MFPKFHQTWNILNSLHSLNQEDGQASYCNNLNLSGDENSIENNLGWGGLNIKTYSAKNKIGQGNGCEPIQIKGLKERSFSWVRLGGNQLENQ